MMRGMRGLRHKRLALCQQYQPMAKSKIGRARQLAKRALRRANQRGDEAGMAAAKAKLRTLHEQTQKARKPPTPKKVGAGPRPGITWDQVRRINSWRRLHGYHESEQLAERMARDRDE